MHTRQLGIIAFAAIVAFAAAFGVGTVTKNSAASATSGSTVKALEVAAAPSVGTITTSAAPSLKAIKATPRKRKVTPRDDEPVTKPPVVKPPVIKQPPIVKPPVIKTQPPKKKDEPVDRGGGED